MLKFKQFVTEQAKPVEQGKVDASGLPCALVNWRRNGAIGPDGVPAALITKPTRKAVQEKMDAPETHEHLGGYYGDKEEWDEKWDNHMPGHELHDNLVKTDKSVGRDVEDVKSYTRDSAPLNRHLYNRHVDGEQHDDTVKGINVKSFDKTVGRNKLKHDMHVYSGVTWHPGDVAKQHPDRHVHLPAYTSTTLSKDVAHAFATGDSENATHVIHFHLKKGQPGKYVEHHTENPGEHEFIMPRNTTIKIHPRPDRYEDAISGNVTHVWHAHVVSKE